MTFSHEDTKVTKAHETMSLFKTLFVGFVFSVPS